MKRARNCAHTQSMRTLYNLHERISLSHIKTPEEERNNNNNKITHTQFVQANGKSSTSVQKIFDGKKTVKCFTVRIYVLKWPHCNFGRHRTPFALLNLELAAFDSRFCMK